MPRFLRSSIPVSVRARIVGVCALALGVVPLAALRAQPSRAEPPSRGAMEFAGDLGYTRYGVSGIRPDGGRLGLTFTAWLAPRTAWSFDIACLGGSPVGASADDGFTICTGSLGAQLEFGVMRRVRPFVRASVGQSQLDWQAALDVFDIDERSGATTLAIGSRFALGKAGRFGARLEAVHLRTDVLGGPTSIRSLALGISYRTR